MDEQTMNPGMGEQDAPATEAPMTDGAPTESDSAPAETTTEQGGESAGM